MPDTIAGIRTYDFRKPSCLPGDARARLQVWQESLCALVAERWMQHLPFEIAWKSVSTATARPAEVLPKLAAPAVAYQFQVAGQPGGMLFVFPRPFVLALVAGMLGDAGEQLPEDRELTAIEHVLFELAMQDLADALTEAQPGAQPAACRLGAAEPSPQRTRMFPEKKDVINCGFEISGPFGTQTCNWLLGHEFAEMFADADEPASTTAAQHPLPEELVCEIPVEVVVQMGRAKLHMSDLANLKSGDVLILDQRVNDPLVASVGGEHKFRGWAGRSGSRQVFQVQSLLDQ